jgi:hypothetical protein
MAERANDSEQRKDHWLIRDLPADVDMRDEDGIYGTKFGELWTTDTEYEWPELLDRYQYGDEATRAAINHAFVHLIGYTLPSLVDLAHGREESSLP